MFWNADRPVDDRAPAAPAGPRILLRRYSRRSSLAALPIVVLVSALLTPTLSANSTGPKLTVSGVPVAGRQVVAVGSGFNSSYTVQLKWDGSAAGMPSVRVAGSGGFSTTVTIPAAALPGRHSLSAVKAAQAWKQGVPGAGVLASTTVVVLDATTPSATATASGSAAGATPTPAADFTPTPSATGTPTPTSTATPTKTPTPTGTATPTLTSTPTPATTPTSAPAATATPTAVPLPSPAPTSAGLTGLYGSRLVMDALANLEIGGSGGWNKRFAYRFRAVTSSSLVSVRWFKRGVNDGHYGAGTGGDIRVSIQTDNGSGHPSGTILASTLYPSIGTGDDRGFLTTFASPASLTAGKLYHVVWENLASDTAHNFISVNSIYTSGSMVSQPGRSRTDWCVENADRINTAWQDESAYYVSPIADYAYGNGVHDGVGYTIPDVVATAAISGNSQVREVFTVSGGTRSVTDVWFRLRRTSGSDPLKIRLETAAGTLIDQGTVAASSIAIGAPYPSDSVSSWAHVQFAQPHTLSSGSTYHLVLSTAASSTYTIVEVWQERAHGYSSATYFGDGHAERNSGAGWSLFSGNSGHDDFQFYLRG